MTNQMRQSLSYLRPSSVSIYLTTDKALLWEGVVLYAVGSRCLATPKTGNR